MSSGNKLILLCRCTLVNPARNTECPNNYIGALFYSIDNHFGSSIEVLDEGICTNKIRVKQFSNSDSEIADGMMMMLCRKVCLKFRLV